MTEPSPSKALRFGTAFAAAALSKFTGLLIFPVVITLAVFTRKKYERNLRLGCALRGVLWAAVLSYLVLLVLSSNQPNDALERSAAAGGQESSGVRSCPCGSTREGSS